MRHDVARRGSQAASLTQGVSAGWSECHDWRRLTSRSRPCVCTLARRVHFARAVLDLQVAVSVVVLGAVAEGVVELRLQG